MEDINIRAIAARRTEFEAIAKHERQVQLVKSEASLRNGNDLRDSLGQRLRSIGEQLLKR